MRKLILAAGVAALAITVPAAAKPDKGGGQSQAQRGGGGGQAKAQRGGGQAKAQRSGGNRQAQAQRSGRQQAQRGGGSSRMERRSSQQQRAERRGGGQQRSARVERNSQQQRVANRGNQRQSIERRGNGGGQRYAAFQSDRSNGKAQRAENRGNGNRNAQRVERRDNGKRDVARVEHRSKASRDVARIDNRNQQRFDARNNAREQRIVADRRGDRFDQRAVRERQFDDRRFREARFDNQPRIRAFDDSQRVVLRDRDDYRRYSQWRDWDDNDWDRHYAYRGIPAAYMGCPPGLAKKSPACVPPGQARSRFVGQVLPTYYSSNYFPRSLRYMYADTPDYYYRWGDGYAYRVNRQTNLVAALLPLIGAGYGVGSYFPYYQQPSYYVPSYYQPFYADSPYDYYRYDDGYVYRIDAGSGYIEDVYPLLDRGYGVGQLMPAGYSYYNVPYQYRSMYYDTPDYQYRYAPGAIYQVDAGTQLVTAIASLLTGGLAVGQPLPPSYSAYNVPLGYRDTYYDRPDAWYRYSDGYIYQVDPTTQLITAIVRSIV